MLYLLINFHSRTLMYTILVNLDGMECKEDPSKQYTTHIDLFCSGSDQGPTFVKTEKCELYINWYTPQACPAHVSKNVLFCLQVL